MVRFVELLEDPSSGPDRYADHDARHGHASNQSDDHGRTDQCRDLPKDHLLSAPLLLAPECTARWTRSGTNVFQVQTRRPCRTSNNADRRSLGRIASRIQIHIWDKSYDSRVHER